MPDEQKIAVILTCYNEGPYIGAAIRSVLEQTRAELIESIVIADDGSGADTVAVLKDIERWDARIQVLYGLGGAGPAPQRNLAIANTSAPIIAMLDGDDLWTPNKLELQLPALASDPNVGLVYSGYFMFPSDNIEAAYRANVRDISGERDQSRAYFKFGAPIICSTTLIRRSVFAAGGGFDTNNPGFEDIDLFMRLIRFCRYAFVDAPLLYKRNHATSFTGTRKDLMAHHAYVSLKAAATDPTLLPLVPARLAEKARKLGNQSFLLGDPEQATLLLKFAARVNPLNIRAWASLIVARFFARPAYYLLASRLRSRRAALGVVEP